MEKLGIKSKSGKAKLLGAFVSIGGALVLILYKRIPIFNPQSHHIAGKTTTPQSTSDVKKWIIGSILLTGGSIFWSSWFLIQEKMFVAVLDLLHEEIYLGSVIGSILVIFGMYMLLWGKSKETKESVSNETQENQNDEEKGKESAVNETHENQNDEEEGL